MSLLGMLTAHIQPEKDGGHEDQIARVAGGMAGGAMSAALAQVAAASISAEMGGALKGMTDAVSHSSQTVPGAGMGGRGGVDFA